ncbi:hypothetical protein O181_002858 [Austropuccinia psidii MF-1]|uniref:Uncharacterized protein n=1 Tax=Austropuccinia psidii MF-1 TaxID=1389203 RepID=A0A9Q3BDB1_9BASI|nr:hypothetical protein [Austropuccinia psidii MF-1]
MSVLSSPPKCSNKRKSTDGQLDTELSSKKKSGRKSKPSLKGDVPPLGKFLASNDKTTRDRAVAALHKFLSMQPGFAEGSSEQRDVFDHTEDNADASWKPLEADDLRMDTLELAKLYKGLFYCYWMSDKPLVQQDLAKELAQLCLVVRPRKAHSHSALAQVLTTQAALSFWKGFWETLSREWHGVDKHRIDKYLLLMRRFVEVGFKILQRMHWNSKAISIWSNILKETIFNVEDCRTPLSIAYHFSDIFLTELDRVLEQKPSPPAPILLLLSPLCHALSKACAGTATFAKILENIFDPLLENFDYFDSNHLKKPSSSTIALYPTFETSLSNSSSSTGTINTCTTAAELKVNVLKLLFETGSNQNCSDANRRKLYQYWSSKGGAADDE